MSASNIRDVEDLWCRHDSCVSRMTGYHAIGSCTFSDWAPHSRRLTRHWSEPTRRSDVTVGVRTCLRLAGRSVWVVRRLSTRILKMKLITPSKTRRPFFDGWETDNATYRFSCDSCRSDILVTFSEMLQSAWGWKEKTAKSDRMTLAAIFHIDLARRSIADGMDAVIRSSCPSCGAVYFSHFWFHEYRHSAYQISLRAIAFDTSKGVA